MKGEKILSQELNINLKIERLKGTFKRGLHYFKYSPRKILYDEDALFAFIKERDGKHICKEEPDMGELISRWAKNTKAYAS